MKSFAFLFDALVSICAAVFIFRVYPGEFFDDAGFVMRYLEHFKQGYFYAYNPSDGPVFGISSPVFGLITGALCSTGLLLPEQAIRRSAFVGTALLIFLLIRIFKKTADKNISPFLLALVALGGSKMFLNVMKAGLETPIHIAIVLMAFWAYYGKHHRAMWFFLAVAIVSKLDAVPLAAVVAFLWCAENYHALEPVNLKNKHWQNIFFFAVLPVCVWILTAVYFFGSPLPQSAYAKINFHSHPDDHWFPFFVRYAKDGFFSYITGITLVLSIVLALRALLTKSYHHLRLLLPGLSFVATMALYYFYNPGERMMWYYALPDFLLLIQLAMALGYFTGEIANVRLRTVVFATHVLALFFFLFPDVYGGKYWLDAYLNTVEYERDLIGKYLAEQVPEHDTVMVWHGMPGRYTKGYVMDMSGLNSKLVTEHKRDMAVMIQKFKPNYVVNHAYGWFTANLPVAIYALDTVFYDITAYDYPSWQVYKRVYENTQHLLVVNQSHVEKGLFSEAGGIARVAGDTVWIRLPQGNYFNPSLLCGIRKQNEDVDYAIEFWEADTLRSSTTTRVTPIGRIKEHDAKHVKAFKWNFSDSVASGVMLKIYALNKPAEIILVDPIVATQKLH